MGDLQIFTLSGRWEGFRGESTDKKDVIFRTKKSSLFQLHTNLDIFLSNCNNISESEEEKFSCDYKLKGGWMARSFTVYAGGDTSTSPVAAQVRLFITLYIYNKRIGFWNMINNYSFFS